MSLYKTNLKKPPGFLTSFQTKDRIILATRRSTTFVGENAFQVSLLLWKRIPIIASSTHMGIAIEMGYFHPDSNGDIWIQGTSHCILPLPEKKPPYRDEKSFVAHVMQALHDCIGPEAQARVHAVNALGRAVLARNNTASGIIRPLLDKPRLIINGSSISLLRGRGNKPNLKEFLKDGKLRRINTRPREGWLKDLNTINIKTPPPTAHQRFELTQKAIDAFTPFGIDISPWI